MPSYVASEIDTGMLYTADSPAQGSSSQELFSQRPARSLNISITGQAEYRQHSWVLIWPPTACSQQGQLSTLIKDKETGLKQNYNNIC